MTVSTACARDHLIGVELAVEHGDEPRGGRAERNLARSNGEPALHGGGFERRFRQPVGAAAFLRQIDEDGVGIGDDVVSIDEHGNLPEAVQSQILGLFVLGAVMFFMLDAKQMQKQTRAMRMAGQRVVIELHEQVPWVNGRWIPASCHSVWELALGSRIPLKIKSLFLFHER